MSVQPTCQLGEFQQELEKLSGSVERVTFHNEDNGFCVLKVKVDGITDLVAITAKTPSIAPGEYIECEGSWQYDKRHGRQFQASTLQIIPPNTLEGIKKYLSSGMVKGVGAHYAKQLVNAFGQSVFDVIEHQPERLSSLPGFGKKRCEQIAKAFEEQKTVRDIMVFLQTHGLGAARAVRIFKTYGHQALERVQQNPYDLARDIRGIGFTIADELAQRLGIEKESVLRAQAGLSYVLQTESGSGHCAVKQSELLEKTAALLVIPTQVIQQALLDEIDTRRLIVQTIHDQAYVFLSPLFHAEKGVATHIIRLLHGQIPWHGLSLEKALPWLEQKTRLPLSTSQVDAINTVLASKVAIITGGPGVGKTTVVNSILTLICKKQLKVVLCAPTGRAAKRLSETTHLSAKTIHRLLEFDPISFSFKRDETNPLEGDLFVIDEASMVDVILMNQFLRALPQSAGLLIVGDVDQLPSVGPGVVLADLIESTVVPTARLHEIFRQAADSQIITTAHDINRGQIPSLKSPTQGLSDFYFIRANTPEDIHAKLTELMKSRIPSRFGFDPFNDIQVLTPMNRAGLGTQALNVLLQSVLNPLSEPRIERFGTTFAVGDKVIQTINNYDKEVYNGDIGRISRINVKENTLTVNYDQRAIEYDWKECDEISLAYAITIHKSQGSEYPAIIIPLSMQHYTMLQRNLIYTALTRGKKLVIVVGDERALKKAVLNQTSKKRLTYLSQRLLHKC